MAHHVITTAGRYKVSDGDTVEIVGNTTASRYNIRFEQDASDPAPYANVEFTFTGDITGKSKITFENNLSSTINVDDNVQLHDTRLTVKSPWTPGTDADKTTTTINLGDDTRIKGITLPGSRNTDTIINSGDNVVWGEDGDNNTSNYAIYSLIDDVDGSDIYLNLGANNSFIGNIIDAQNTTVYSSLDGATIDVEGPVGVRPNIWLTGTYSLSHGGSAHADNLTVKGGEYIEGNFSQGGGSSDPIEDGEFFIRGLNHEVDGANANGLVDVDGGILLGSLGDDTLHLGGDLITNDALYWVDGSRYETDTTITDTLDFQYVDEAQKTEFINAYVAAGGLYDPATGVFSAPPGVDPGRIEWQISQQDGTGTIGFVGWEAVTISPLNGSVVCFTRGTLIKTVNGDVPVENLRSGDKVLTMDRGFQPIRWIGSRKVSSDSLQANPKLRPVRINAGAMGPGLPERDLLVSRQHRMMVRSDIAQDMFNTSEVLVAAIKLCEREGIDIVDDAQEVEYFHILFDQHEVIYAENTPSESLFAGPEAIKSLPILARKEVLTLFPELLDIDYRPRAVRAIPKGHDQKIFVKKHAELGEALV